MFVDQKSDIIVDSKLNQCIRMNLIFRMLTEVWEIKTLENRIIAPTLPDNCYREVGVFLVDIGYCKKT